jgi:hypothetical protein
VAGSVKESMKPVVPLQIPVDANEVPLDCNTLTTTALQPTYVLPLRFILNCWPDVPLNVNNAFCPAVVVVAVTGVPTLIVPVTSEKVLRSRVMLPVVVPWGFTSTVYVSVAGNVMESTKPAVPLQMPEEPSELPSDFKALTITALQPVYVEPLIIMLIC